MDERLGVITLLKLDGVDTIYKLNISASDGVFSCSTEVHVTLFSANIHSPAFDRDLYEVTFTENQTEGVRVAKVVASDNDLGDVLHYQILSHQLLQVIPYTTKVRFSSC